MIQSFRLKLDSIFSHLQFIFLLVNIQKISAADMLYESAEMFPQLQVYISDSCHCTCVAAAYLVVMQHAQNGKKNCRLYFDMTN